MFMVFWVEAQGAVKVPKCQEYELSDMIGAMRHMERLRSEQSKGGQVSHVTLSSQNPHAVGNPGVADPAPDYNWKKRRA